MSATGGTRAVIAAMAANAVIAAMKFGAWALTGASSLLAEGIHSVADTSNQILLLVGGRRAKKAATTEHPFGFGRERYVAAFLVAIILFSLGGLFALYEAFHKYEEIRAGHPNELLEGPWWWVPLVVLAGAIVAESFSLRTAVRESGHAKGDQSWFRFIRTSRSPELPVVLLEDVAALLGLAFALSGVGLTLLTHNGLWDVAGTALIGVLLIVVAGILAVETRSLLIGESATPESVKGIETALSLSDGVERIVHLRTLHMGPDEVMVTVKIAVDPALSAQRVADIINGAEAAIRGTNPMVTTVYIEPDIWHGASSEPSGEEA